MRWQIGAADSDELCELAAEHKSLADGQWALLSLVIDEDRRYRLGGH
jgi:hypothetical protein